LQRLSVDFLTYYFAVQAKYPALIACAKSSKPQDIPPDPESPRRVCRTSSDTIQLSPEIPA